MAGNENSGRKTLYDEAYNEQAYKLCLLGATDAELADFFEVHVDTIYEWKNNYPFFSESIKKGKYAADSSIAQSLYDRAKGCRITKQSAIKLTTKIPVNDKDGNPTRTMQQTERIEIVNLEEDVPPDTTAAIFWLKNRQPKEWRDKQILEHEGYSKPLPAVVNIYNSGPPLSGSEDEINDDRV